MIRATVGSAIGSKADGAAVGDINSTAVEGFGVNTSQTVIVSAAAFGGKDEIGAVIDNHAVCVFHIQSGLRLSPHLHISLGGAVGLMIECDAEPDSCALCRAINEDAMPCACGVDGGIKIIEIDDGIIRDAADGCGGKNSAERESPCELSGSSAGASDGVIVVGTRQSGKRDRIARRCPRLNRRSPQQKQKCKQMH